MVKVKIRVLKRAGGLTTMSSCFIYFVLVVNYAHLFQSSQSTESKRQIKQELEDEDYDPLSFPMDDSYKSGIL